MLPAAVAILGSLELASARDTTTTTPDGTYSEKLDLVSDASVADSLERQKNLNFSSVRIDGEKTSIALSALTADQIQSAVATKVPTPDLDADAIGGELQLTSRRAFEQKEPTLRGSAAASYDPLVGKPMPEASITHGRSFGSREQFGYLATFEHSENRDGDEEIELDWDDRTTEPRSFDVSETREASAETNINGSVDWKLGEGSFAFIRAEAQFATERVSERQLGYDLPAFTSPASGSAGVLSGATLRRSLEEGRFLDRTFSLAAGANVSWEPWLMELRMRHRESRHRVPDERSYEFAEEDVAIAYRRPEPEFPLVASPTGALPGNPAQQYLDELQLHREEDRESDDVASFDLTRAPRDGGTPLRLKFGGKARLQRTTRDERHDIHEPAGAAVRVSEVLGPPARGRILSGRYSLDGFPSPDALRVLFEAQPERFALDESKTRSDTDPANFDVRQHILATYAMVSVPAGANHLVIGARVEHTASEFGGFEVAFDERGRYESTRAIAARSRFTHLFPGIHASRAFSDKMRLFASWTQSIRRPDYVDTVPARRISRFDRTIEEGNAMLRPALYTNYDVAVDYAYRDDGSLSLEVFHRDIRDPTLTRRTFLADGPFAGYERTRPENGRSARIQGFQLTWTQEFAVLAERLDGLEFEVNYTHERSRQSVDNRAGESLALTERPARELAVQLSYDRGPYYVSIDFTHTSRTLDSVGAGPGEDVFVQALNNWDVTLSRQFRKGLRVFLEIENVTAAPDRAYVGDRSRPHEYAVDLREYRLGLKWGL